QGAADHHLLLVAAAECGHRLVDVAGDDLEAPHLALRNLRPPPKRDQSQAVADAPEHCHREVFVDAELWRKPSRVAILRHVAQPAAEDDRPRPPPDEARDRISYGGRAGALQPDESYALPRAN